jgi:hypothetical protein
MFGWHENSRIAAIFRIEIVTVQPNTNMLFRNSEKSLIFDYSHLLFSIPLFIRYSLHDPNIPIVNANPYQLS